MSARRCALALLGATVPCVAAARVDAQARLEARGDVLAGRSTSWHAGAGVAWAVGDYVRLGAVAGGGVTRGLPREVADDGAAPSGRAELVVRFVVDPSEGTGLRWYGGAGAGALFVRGTRGQARVHVVAGVEGRPRGGVRLGLEAGVGGGARVGVVLRRADPPAR